MYHKKFTVALFGLCLLFTNVAHADLFRLVEKQSHNINEFPKWTSMLERLQKEDSDCNKNKQCALNKLADLIKNKTKNSDKLEIISQVNKYVNQVKYVKDAVRWNQSDYWATPEQFFANGGDCEDYAIAKFSLLKKMGFNNSDMRVVVLKDVYKNIIHSILVVSVDGKQYILDNDIPKVVQTKEIRQYRPIFSINESDWWKYMEV